VGCHEGEYFIAMEYIAGESVARLQNAAIERGEVIPQDVVLRIIRDAAEGLHHAHEVTDSEGQPLHLMHRDISPQNLMVGSNGVTKVVDFGIAKASNRRSPTTAQGVLKGKFGYMAPEMLFGDAVDQTVDQYALGIVLRELLLARPYLPAVEGAAAAFRFMAKPVPPIRSEDPRISEGLAAIVDRMLQFVHGDRFDHLGQVIEALDAEMGDVGHDRVAAFVDHIAGDAVRALLAETAPTRAIVEASNTTAQFAARPPRRRLFAVTAAAVVASAVGTAWLLTPADPIPITPPMRAIAVPPALPAPAPAAPEPPPEPAEAPVTPPAVKKRRAARAKAPPPPAERAAVEASGELTLTTTPNARVSIDGGPWLSTPVYRKRLEAGRHTVRAKVEDAKIDVTFDVDIEPGQLKKVRKNLR
jgi:serine/threonine-protein kinase